MHHGRGAYRIFCVILAAMDTVTLDGKTYVRAVKAAEEIGYAPDYVGQLCRGGKVEAKRLGKTWYVREDALAEHKRSKPRKNAGTTRRDVQHQREQLAQTPVPAQARATPNFVRPLMSSVRYIHEDMEPIPQLSKVAPQYHAEEEREAEATHHEEEAVAPEAAFEEEMEPSFSSTEQEGDENEVTDTAPEEDAADSSVEGAPVSLRRLHTPKKSERRRLLEQTLMDHAVRTQDVPTSAAPAQTPVRPAAQRSLSQHQESRVMVRPSLLPAVALVAVLLVVANTFLESTWRYTRAQAESGISTSYGITSFAAVSEALRGDF